MRPMKQKILTGFSILALLISAMLPFAIARADDELLPVNITINTVSKGDYLVTVTGDDDIIMSGSDFKLLDIKLNVGNAEKVSLKKLAPKVEYTLDKETLNLKITADPRLLGQSVIALSKESLATAAKLTAPHEQHPSFYATYALNTQLAIEGDSSNVIQIPLELGYRSRGYLFENTIDYSTSLDDEGDKNVFQRLKTRITLDNLQALTRVQLGDQSAQGGLLGGGGVYGGIGISSTRSFNPNLRNSAQSISGIVETPSDVDIYVNDRLVDSGTLSPGRFEFNNLPPSALGQEATIVIRDSFGKVRTIKQHIYNGLYTLDKGEQEYSYTLGLERIDFKKAGLNGYAEEPTFVGTHRYGFSETFTGGYSLEATRDIQNFGLGAAYLIGVAEFSAGVAASRSRLLTDEELGYAAYATFSYGSRAFSISLNGRYEGDNYRTVSPFEVNGPEYAYTANMNIRLSNSTSVNLSYEYEDLRVDGVQETAGFRLQSRLASFVTWELSGRYETSDIEPDDYVIATGLSFRFGGPDLFLGYQEERNGLSTATADLQGDEILDDYVPWRLIYNRIENEETGFTLDSLAGNLTYEGQYGIANLNVDRELDDMGVPMSSIGLDFSGGYGSAKGVSAFGRPIHDGFAVVKAGKLPANMKGIRVKLGSEDYGLLESNDAILVQGLTGYLPDVINTEIEGDVIEYELNKINHKVAVAPKGGRLLNSSVIRRVYVEGKVFVTFKGERKAVEQAAIELSGPEGTQELSTGSEGLFFGENLAPGNYLMKVYVEKKSCDINFRIAEATDLLTDIGELHCEIN